MTQAFYTNHEDFMPGSIGKDFSGSEVFELVRMAINAKIKEAEREVDRLTRIVHAHAKNMHETGDRLPDVGVPAMQSWRATDDMIALQVARAQLAALNSAWLAALHGVGGPDIHTRTQEALDAKRAQHRLEARHRLARSLGCG